MTLIDRAIGDLAIGDREGVTGIDPKRLSPRLIRGERPAMITILALTARRINIEPNSDPRGAIGDFAIGDKEDAGAGVGAPFRVYLSDGDFCGRPDDTGWAHVNADPRLISAPTIEEQFPYGADDQARGAIQNTGAELANTDRYWDKWLKEFSAVGELAEVYLVEEGGRVIDGFRIGSFRVGNMVPAGNICRIEPERVVTALERPAQQVLFSGGGGAAGDASLAGVAQEMTFGTCRGVPVLFKDYGRLRFGFHPGPIGGFTLYEDAVTKVAWDGVDHPNEASFMDPANDPAPGFYTKCTAIGDGRLGTARSGVLTADVDGAKIFGVFSNATGDILAGLARSVYPLSRISLGTFAGLPRAPVGIHIPRGSGRTMADVFSSMLRPFAANYYEDPDGRLAITVGAPPGEGAALWAVTDDDLLNEDAVAHPGQVRWQVRVSYGRQWRPLSASDVAAEVDALLLTPEEADRVTTEEQWAIESDQSVRLRYRNALPVQSTGDDALKVRGYFVEEADAVAAAVNLLAFYRQPLIRQTIDVPIGSGFGGRGARPGSVRDRGATGERWVLDCDPQTVQLDAVMFSPLAPVVTA